MSPGKTKSPLKRGPSNRGRILKAAAALFRKRGFHGTSTREIAERADVSLGNIYNHFDTKEAIFASLLKEYEKEYFQTDQPLMRALAKDAFPDDIESLGRASRETVEKFSDYFRMIYIDIVEFNARHIARLFQGMRKRYRKYPPHASGRGTRTKLADWVDPAAAMMMVSWTFNQYFVVEKLFGAKGHYGMSDEQVIRFFAKVFRRGVLSGRG